MAARRDFLRQIVPAGALGVVGFKTGWLERVVSAAAATADVPAADVAKDESYWREIQQAFTLDRTIINLNNGYTCPSPRVVTGSTRSRPRPPRSRAGRLKMLRPTKPTGARSSRPSRSIGRSSI